MVLMQLMIGERESLCVWSEITKVQNIRNMLRRMEIDMMEYTRYFYRKKRHVIAASICTLLKCRVTTEIFLSGNTVLAREGKVGIYCVEIRIEAR